MLVACAPHDLAQPVVGICLGAEQNHRLVGLGAFEERGEVFGALADARDQHARRQGVQRPAMADLDLHTLVAVASAVVVSLTSLSLILDPRSERF